MNIHTDKTQKNKSQSVDRNDSSKQNTAETSFQFADNRPETNVQRKLNEMANNSPEGKQAAQLKAIANKHSENPIQKKGLEDEEMLQGKFNPIQKKGLEEEELLQGKFEPIQKKENNTGLPDKLKSGAESLSGQSLDDVKVNYNSAQPAQLNAHAYAQGTNIHLAPGQEKHLPHEAWHVVQQKQGRVKATMQMKGNVNVNDDEGLEKEADVMGAKAVSQEKTEDKSFSSGNQNQVTQSKAYTNSTQGIKQFYRTEKGKGNQGGSFIYGSPQIHLHIGIGLKSHLKIEGNEIRIGKKGGVLDKGKIQDALDSLFAFENEIRNDKPRSKQYAQAITDCKEWLTENGAKMPEKKKETEDDEKEDQTKEKVSEKPSLHGYDDLHNEKGPVGLSENYEDDFM